jgi:hypothetical protein
MWVSPLARVAAGLPRPVANFARARLLGASSVVAPVLAARFPPLSRAEDANVRFISVKPAGSPPGASEMTASAETSPPEAPSATKSAEPKADSAPSPAGNGKARDMAGKSALEPRSVAAGSATVTAAEPAFSREFLKRLAAKTIDSKEFGLMIVAAIFVASGFAL